MSAKNIIKRVDVSGELENDRGKWMIKKIRSCPHTITLGHRGQKATLEASEVRSGQAHLEFDN